MLSPTGPSSLLFFISYLSCFICIQASQNYLQAQESDRVLNLPGLPSHQSLSHFSGYITVNKDHGRQLFYWFFEAQTNPSKKPLLLWLNGGPGCSSIGYGSAVELGPFKVKRNGVGLEFNEHSWNKDANLLFVESPVGVGFSYTNTSSDLTKLDDGFVAGDAYSFLVNWFRRFPQYRAHDFYIAGESYAGHYVPQLAELVYDRNKEKKSYPVVNLKGFIVGNPETDFFYDSKGLLEYAWSHGVISDQIYKEANKVCNFKLLDWGDKCEQVMGVVFQQYEDIDIYNIYAPKCLLHDATSSTNGSHTENFHPESEKRGLRRRMRRNPGGYDPCFEPYTEEYLNRVDVQKAIHANITGNIHGKWKVCSDSMLQAYNITVFSVLPIYTKLIKAGLRIWVYSGDVDGRVPVIGTRYWVEALGLPLKTPWHSWYHNHQVGGRFVKYQGIIMASIRGAGHLVPLNKPNESLLLINAFLSAQDLPTQR